MNIIVGQGIVRGRRLKPALAAVLAKAVVLVRANDITR